jgi:hypothetical protein
MGQIRNTYKLLERKSEEKRPLGGPRCRREDNIKMGLREIRLRRCGLDADDRVQWRIYVKKAINLWVP